MSKRKAYTPRRVEILVPSGAGYMKRGQFGYVIGENRSRGKRYEVFCQDKEGGSSGKAYLVAKTKEARGGALWFSPAALRFTAWSKKS